ncbi:MAG: hypothetical protein O3A95_03445 [Planctomycetota bacterium]|nr:hypothetical protein [Planctomycetota bacterium]MDA1113336.1 hypothetical protein [Planctomycetota bacterium]
MAIPHLLTGSTVRRALLSLCLAYLSASLSAQQITTVDTSIQTRSIVFSPALPPNSTEIFYDDGDFSGVSRNLQNANIIPGWSYWAHSVLFTPTPIASGRLLEVRYVGATQWGTSLDFDILIRDASGLVLGSLLQQTAVMDTANWQVIDVSSLNLTVGTSDFSIELRPSNPCGGDTGFTIPYSVPSVGRSSFSADCNDSAASFVTESRNLFLRAVVEDGVTGPSLSITPLIAGQSATLSAGNLTPSQTAFVGRSLAGGGPWTSPVGVANLTPPVTSFSILADAQGNASLTFNVPAGLAGTPVWLQIYDPGTLTLGESIATSVQ